MGEHKLNGAAIAKASQPPFRSDEIPGFGFQACFELNKDTVKEMTAEIDLCRAQNGDMRALIADINERWSPKANPERYDYVVYNVPSVGRPSLLTDRVPTATIRYSEHIRIPLVELRKRVDDAFEQHDSPDRGPSH